MNPPSELPPVMLWMREKRLQDLIENPLYSHQRTNLEKVLRMFQSGEIAPLWADHQLYFCNGELVGSKLPADTRSLPGPVWHEPECGLAHEAAAYEQARQANVAPQVGTGDNQRHNAKRSDKYSLCGGYGGYQNYFGRGGNRA